jgi:hypothetical protein
MTAFAGTDGRNWDGSLTTPTAATGTVTYNPSSIDANGVATWYAANSIIDARKRLSMSVRQPSKGSQVARVQVKLMHPVMDTVDTSLKIGECLVNVECVFPKVSTQAQRDLLIGHLIYFLNDGAEFAAAVDNLEAVY